MRRKIIFISDQFGYQNGGCNTVNYELSLALCQIVEEDIKVCALVLNCQPADRVSVLEKRAETLGIQLIHQNVNPVDRLSKADCEKIYNVLSISNEEADNAIWVGHDIFTGYHAIDLAKHSRGISAVIIHTDYDTIEGIKGIESKGFVKERKQRDIIRRADFVYAIGPRLMGRVREIRRKNTWELIPGFSSSSEDVLENNRKIIAFGRYEGTVGKVKQIDLVMAAFGRAVAKMANNKDYILHIIGIPDADEEKRLRTIAENYAGKVLSINFNEYTQKRSELLSDLKNNCAGLMVSISEGFGMTGWEMIAAGLPLILTRKSGLYDYLVKRFGHLANGMCIPVDLKGSFSGELCEEDVELVSDKIVMAFQNERQLRCAAEELRNELRSNTWYNMAHLFASRMSIQTSLFGSTEIYKDTYKTRKECIEEILNELERGEKKRKYVIFFGGVSSQLCEERAIHKFENWLRGDNERCLVFCYETGEAAQKRARELDAGKMPEGLLSNDPEKRMEQKALLVESTREKYAGEVRNQILYIKLATIPYTYVIVVDGDIYFTLMLEIRSSESMTMRLGNSALEEKRKIIESMEYTLKGEGVNEDEKKLLRIFANYREEYL